MCSGVGDSGGRVLRVGGALGFASVLSLREGQEAGLRSAERSVQHVNVL